eukprot:SAG31_NODE_1404_length_8479_cov_2.258760_6_plen_107_part_00
MLLALTLASLALHPPAAVPSGRCDDGEAGDQRGGRVLSGEPEQPGGFNNRSTAAQCCAFCFAPGAEPAADAWVWQPSTTHCWCIAATRGALPRTILKFGTRHRLPP